MKKRKDENKNFTNMADPNLLIFHEVDRIEPGKDFKGFKIVNSQGRVFRKPEPKDMNRFGCSLMFLLCLFFWPISCLPCCLTCSYDKHQSPIYTDNTGRSYSNDSGSDV